METYLTPKNFKKFVGKTLNVHYTNSESRFKHKLKICIKGFDGEYLTFDEITDLPARHEVGYREYVTPDRIADGVYVLEYLPNKYQVFPKHEVTKYDTHILSNAKFIKSEDFAKQYPVKAPITVREERKYIYEWVGAFRVCGGAYKIVVDSVED